MFDRHPVTAARHNVSEDTQLGRDLKASTAYGIALSGLHSLEFEPLTDEERHELRRLGRESRPFDALAKQVVRLQFIAAFMPPDGDPEARRGLRRKERALLLEVFASGFAGSEKLRLGAMLSRCVPDDGDNLVPMLATALEFDCMRLGLVNGDGAEVGQQ